MIHPLYLPFLTRWIVPWIDQYAVVESVTHTSMRDPSFRETILSRDSECVFTGDDVDACQAAHLIAAKKGDDVCRQLLDPALY